LQGPGIIIVPKGHVHLLIPQQNLRGHALRFRDEFLPQGFPTVLGHLSPLGFLPLHPDALISLQKLLNVILDHTDQTSSVEVRRHLFMAFFQQILHLFPQAEHSSESRSDWLNTWRRVESLVDVHFATQVSLAHIAKEAFVSERTLQQIAKSVAGVGIMEAIESRRILEAKRLLRYSDYGLKEVAHAVGFQDPSYFSRVFRKREGLSPSDFRMSARPS
jgi:AraC-like DNA-binding protein